MSQIQDVKQATDIVQLISERVSLTRSGANWKGLCPFHSEKSPSFHVNEQLQRYKCFGCGESGDAFTFLEKYEGMTFAEALQTLADRAGIKLEKTNFSKEDDQRQRLLEILNLTKEYYHFVLTQHKLGEPARAYLKERGVTSESIKIFQLGYSLPDWDGLLKYLNGKKKYSMADIEAAGLIISKGQRPYDRFRGRIMFPLTDHRGRVVGFSGRILDKEAKEAKYINSPETMLYHKAQMLFGYSHLYQALRKENEAVVVEGEFDVISSAQAHVNHVVGVKGSALTEDHMRLLSRTVSRVILSFDSDAAGVEATRRAIEVAKPFGIEVRVISFDSIPNLDQSVKSKDPDELVRTMPQVWRQAVKSSISVYDFFLQAAVKKHGVTTPEGKRKIIDELAPIFGHISHAVEYEFYADKLAKILGVKTELVKGDLQKFKEIKRRGLSTTRPTSSKREEPKAKEKTPVNPRKVMLEDYALFLLFNSPADVVHARAEKLKHISFAQPGVRQVIVHILQSSPPFHMAQFAAGLGEDLQQILFDASINSKYLDLLPQLDIDKEWTKVVKELIDIDIAEEIQRINQELEQTEDEAKQAELLRRVVQLRSRKA